MSGAPTAGGRLAQLKVQLLKRQVEKALEEQQLLKQEVHAEVDVHRANEKGDKLRAKLKQLTENEAREREQLCYGLPPDWGGACASSGSTAALAMAGSGAGTGGGWSGHWLGGVEIQYSVTATTAVGSGPGGRQARLEVTHSEHPVRLQVYRLPFAYGGLRQAFYAKDESGGRFVLKRALRESHRFEKRVRELHADAEAAALSRAAADAFNQAAGQHGGTVTYLQASIVILQGRSSGDKVAYLKEPWLDGRGSRWAKFTRNDGHIFEEGDADGTVQAFTHYSLHYLRPRLGCDSMVLDAQGIRQPAGVGSTQSYTLTDPALVTQDKRYGATDLGASSIAAFLTAHSCNSVCTQCGCTGTLKKAVDAAVLAGVRR